MEKKGIRNESLTWFYLWFNILDGIWTDKRCSPKIVMCFQKSCNLNISKLMAAVTELNKKKHNLPTDKQKHYTWQ